MEEITFDKALAIRRSVIIKACRIMKIASVLFIACCLHANARGYSQSITLSVKNAKLETVFEEIQKQAGYKFVYKWEILSESKPVDIQVKNAPLKDVLDLCFKDQPLSYTIIDNIIVVSKKEKKDSQGDSIDDNLVTVRGKVVNERGEAISGATIAIKGTKRLTTTNENGEFFLDKVDENATLVFTSVNIETYEIRLNGNTDLVIHAKTKITTGETVVVEANTGYQKVKPNETNGSIVVIDNKTLNEQTGTNILNRLDGVTSGLYFNIGKDGNSPQDKTNISIRGRSTLEGPLDPLIVLDNFVYEGDINNINPNDVESITVLKDAAATSIYGARGGNGVIVITTKKGRFNQKLKVEFNTNTIVFQKPDLYSLPQMSSPDYVDVEQFLFNNGYFDADVNNIAHTPLTPAVEIFLKRRNGLLSAADSATQINTLKSIDNRGQYSKYFYQNGITQQYSLNLRGGTDNLAWLISGNYDRVAGNLKTQSNKLNFGFNNSYKPLKNLLLNLRVYYTNSSAQASGAPAYNSIRVDNRTIPYLQFADDEGNALSVATNYREGYIDTTGGGRLLIWKYYPLDDYKHNPITSKREDITANAGLNYQVTKYLNIELNYQYQIQRSSGRTLYDEESYYTRDMINKFTRLGNSQAPDTFRVPKGGILILSNSSQHSQNFRGQLNFARTWNEHAITAIAGAEVREAVSTGNNSSWIYGYHDDPTTYGSVDFFTPYTTFVTGIPQKIPGAPVVAPITNYRFLSLYTNASYTFRNRYSASISVRREGSNIFGALTNDKWKPLWSAGLGWELSKEKFYKVSRIPYLKIRTTFGYSGNVDLSKTPLPVARYSTNSVTNLPFTRIDALNDPELRWEKIMQTNIGINFSLAKRIVSGNIDYFFKKGTDLYGYVPIDYTVGGPLTIARKNTAVIEGSGVEANLITINIDRKVKWSTRFLFNYNTSKTIKYYGPLANSIGFLTDGQSIIPVLRKPLYSIAAYKWGGLNSSGDPQGYLNGHLSTDYLAISNEAANQGLKDGTLFYVGPANPSVFGSLVNEVRWKGFSLSLNIAYKFGYYFRKPSINYNALFQFGSGHQDFAKRWQKPGDELITNVPALVYTNYPQFENRTNFYSMSEINVLKAGHIRLQYVNLDYTIEKWKKKIPFQLIQLYLNAANLGIIWRANKEKIDPDYPGILGPQKQFTIGLKGNF